MATHPKLNVSHLPQMPESQNALLHIYFQRDPGRSGFGDANALPLLNRQMIGMILSSIGNIRFAANPALPIYDRGEPRQFFEYQKQWIQYY